MKGLAIGRRSRMPTPLEDLEREHSMVRRALGVLVRIAGHVEAGLPFPSSDVVTLLRFFREFVEAVHHRKEVEILYPAAVMVGGDAGARRTGLLVHAHEDTRALLHSLVLFWEPDGELLDPERRGFAETCRAYSMRLHRHMEAEEEELFRVLRTGLHPDDRIAMAREFAAVDRGCRNASAWQPELLRLERDWRA